MILLEDKPLRSYLLGVFAESFVSGLISAPEASNSKLIPKNPAFQGSWGEGSL